MLQMKHQIRQSNWIFRLFKSDGEENGNSFYYLREGHSVYGTSKTTIYMQTGQ